MIDGIKEFMNHSWPFMLAVGQAPSISPQRLVEAFIIALFAGTVSAGATTYAVTIRLDERLNILRETTADMQTKTRQTAAELEVVKAKQGAALAERAANEREIFRRLVQLEQEQRQHKR